MSTLNFRRFTRPERLKSIAPRNLNQLLTPYADWLGTRGFVLPAGSVQPDLAHLSQILAQPTADTPHPLLEALFLIDEVAHGPNIELLLKDVENFGLFLEVEEGASPADIAVQVYLLDPQVLLRRHSMLVLDRVRTFESFRAGTTPVPELATPDEEVLQQMGQAMDVWFERKQKGIGTRVLCLESGDMICFVIRHGDLFKREGAVGTDGGDEKVLYRPERYDAVAYHRRHGELRINGRTKGEKDLYRRMIGTHLFGDENFFPKNQPRYTLEPLRQDGKASLACLDVEGIERITLLRLVFNWGGKRSEQETRQADDLFSLYEEKGIPFPPEPEIRSATFEIKFTDSKSPRRVTVRPPNIASFTRDGDSPLVEEWLRKRDFVVEEAFGNGIIHHQHILAGA